MTQGNLEHQTAVIALVAKQLQALLYCTEELAQLIPGMPCTLAYVGLLESCIVRGTTLAIGTTNEHDSSVIDAALQEREEAWYSVATCHDVDVLAIVDQVYDRADSDELECGCCYCAR